MTKRNRATVALLLVGAFMAGLDLFIVNIAFPSLVADFDGATVSGLSWVLNAYAIVYAALLVPAGRWADAYGARRVFLLGLALFTAASAACAAAPSPEVLVATRVVQAAGAALMTPSSLALLLGLFGADRRALVVAGWAATGAAAAAAGPPIGGLLVQADWRWIFLVNVPVGVAALALGVVLLPRLRANPDAARPDTAGAAGVVVAVGALVGGIVQGPEWGWGDPRVLGAFLVALATTAVVVRRCLRHPVPVLEPALFRVRSFRVAVGAAVVFYAGFAAMLLGGVLFLTEVRGEDALTAGLQFAPGPAMAALTSVPGARVAARIGMARVGAFGAAVFALGTLWWLAAASADGAYATTFLPGMLITGLGVGCVMPTVTGAAVAGLPADRLATGSAVATTARQVGSALGVAAAVALLGTGGGAAAFHPVWLFISASALFAAVALAALGRIASAPAPAPATVAA